MNNNDLQTNGEFRNRSMDQYKSTRTVLHDKRAEINRKINVDLLLKRGASNFIDVVRDKKSKAEALQKIKEINLDLQTLKIELDKVNCSFSDYQNNSGQLPMIPVGMKDTTPIDFKPYFMRFLEDHYYADPSLYGVAVDDINKFRNAIMLPSRSNVGIDEHKRYYSLLTIIDHRFFAKEAKRDFCFTWNDSFTGVSFKQLSLAFEKGSVLFNLAALYSQIATACKRDSAESLQESARLFTQGARIFRMLKENFSYAPSPDMSSAMLGLLIRLLMLQAQECNFLEFSMNPKGENENYERLGNYIGQAIALSKKYESLSHSSTSSDFEVLPNSWAGLFEIKGKYYKAQAYYRFAAALLGLVMYGSEADSGGQAQIQQIDQQIEQELHLWMTELNHVVRFTQPISNEDTSSMKNKRSGFASLSKKTGSKSKEPKRSQSMLGSWRKNKVPKQEETEEEEEGEPIQIPKNRFEACQVGIACLREAINYMDDVNRIIRLNDELKCQEILYAYVGRIIDDWKYQRQQLQPTLESLQQRFAPDQQVEGNVTNGDSDGTMRGRKKLRKSTSSASQYAKRGSVQSGNSAAGINSKHAAPRLLALAVNELNELVPRIIFAEDFPLLEDPFTHLGPLEVFNAKNHWTKPIKIRLLRDPSVGYGFCIKGNAPIEIVSCEKGSPADRGGLKPGDLVIGLNYHSALWLSHDEAVEYVKEGCSEKPGGVLDKKLVELIVVRATQPDIQTNSQPPSSKPSNSAGPSNSSLRMLLRKRSDLIRAMKPRPLSESQLDGIHTRITKLFRYPLFNEKN